MSIIVGGVPEHFNYPWHCALEEEVFEEDFFEWQDFPAGTGAMIDALKSKEIHLALLLTEGAVKFCVENPDFQIIKIYVDSPLVWGVHSALSNNVRKKSTKYLISRFGSGSHLMAYLYAEKQTIKLSRDNFEVINTLTSARESLSNGNEGLFLWEKFTTMPFVEKGEMQRIDEIPTPWPCFTLVANKEYIVQNEENISILLDGMNMLLDDFKDRAELAEEISDRYQLNLDKVEEWLGMTEWNSSNEIKSSTLDKVMEKLLALEIINKKVEAKQLVSPLTELLEL